MLRNFILRLKYSSLYGLQGRSIRFMKKYVISTTYHKNVSILVTHKKNI